MSPAEMCMAKSIQTFPRVGELGEEWEVTANGYRVSLWGILNLSNVTEVMTVTTL